MARTARMVRMANGEAATRRLSLLFLLAFACPGVRAQEKPDAGKKPGCTAALDVIGGDKIPDSLRRKAQQAILCQALATRDFALCRRLKDKASAAACLEGYFGFGMLAPKTMGSASLTDLCASLDQLRNDFPYRKGSGKEFCALLVSAVGLRGDSAAVAAACDKLVPFMGSPSDGAKAAARCRKDLASIADCGRSSHPDCQLQVSVMKAASDGPAACGDSPLCRAVMTADAASCEPLLKPFSVPCSPELLPKGQIGITPSQPKIEIPKEKTKAQKSQQEVEIESKLGKTGITRDQLKVEMTKVRESQGKYVPEKARAQTSQQEIEIEVKFRKEYGFPPYKEGDNLIRPGKIEGENDFRKSLEISPYRDDEPFASLLWLPDEERYRKFRNLPEYKLGETLYALRRRMAAEEPPNYGFPAMKGWERVFKGLKVHEEKKFRNQYRLPPYEPGAPYLFLDKFKEEFVFRKTYGLPDYKDSEELACIVLVNREKEFRENHGLAPFRMGQPLLYKEPPHVWQKHQQKGWSPSPGPESKQKAR